MPPAFILTLLKQMGFKPEEFVLQVQQAIAKVNSLDSRLENIEKLLTPQKEITKCLEENP